MRRLRHGCAGGGMTFPQVRTEWVSRTDARLSIEHEGLLIGTAHASLLDDRLELTMLWAPDENATTALLGVLALEADAHGVLPVAVGMKSPMVPVNRLDLSRDRCPMTWVKTRLALETLEQGTLLAVTLSGEESQRDVPRSVAEAGHSPLAFVLDKTSTTSLNGSATLLILKEKELPDGHHSNSRAVAFAHSGQE